jgi:hypothetical protein
MYVTVPMVVVFCVLAALFGAACTMAGRAWGIDVEASRADRYRAPLRRGQPTAAVVRPVPAAPPGWAGHAAPSGEQAVPCSAETARYQRRMAALTAETMDAFDAIRAGLDRSLPAPAAPTGPNPVVVAGPVPDGAPLGWSWHGPHTTVWRWR